MRAQADSMECAPLAFAAGDSEEETARNSAPALAMNEAEFRAFYEATAGQLRAYLRRVCGNASTADDLLQEAYLRLLRAALAPTEEAHRKHYLFRIATNLLRDHFRAAKHSAATLIPDAEPARGGRDFAAQRDMERLLLRLKPRERELLWLAYVEGYRHEEIAKFLSCRAASIRPMLFRARARLAELLRAQGWKRGTQGETKS